MMLWSNNIIAVALPLFLVVTTRMEPAKAFNGPNLQRFLPTSIHWNNRRPLPALTSKQQQQKFFVLEEEGARYNPYHFALYASADGELEPDSWKVDTSDVMYDAQQGGRKSIILSTYKEWCEKFNKEFNEDRFAIFKDNFEKVQAYNSKIKNLNKKRLELNEYADLTPLEYERFMASNKSKSSKPTPKSDEEQDNGKEETPPSTTEDDDIVDQLSNEDKSIHAAYLEWCEKFQKEYDFENRFGIFKSNYVQAASYQAKTGKAMTLNAYADLSVEEYKAQILKDQQRGSSATTSANPTTATSAGIPSRGGTGVAKEAAAVAAIRFQPLGRGPSKSSVNPQGTLTSVDPEVPENIVQTYKEWCQFYGKSYDSNRLRKVRIRDEEG